MAAILVAILLFSSFCTYGVQETMYRASMYKAFIRLKNLGVKYPRVFLAQRYLESAGGTSKIAKENLNLVGMKLPRYRYSPAIGEQNGHAKYESAGDYIYDYVLRQDYWWPIFQKNHYEIESEQDYLEFLRLTGYAEDPAYQVKIRLLIEERYGFLPNF